MGKPRSCVTVLVGQCGNQLGFSLLDSMAANASSGAEVFQEDVSTSYFRPGEGKSSGDDDDDVAPPCARAVLIDMEPKVLEQSQAMAKQRNFFRISKEQCVSREEGSANNWAFGYNSQGASRLTEIEERLRAESEWGGDVCSSYHVVHSIAGGTGSGVGCLVSRVIRDLYPKATLLHSVVWPFTYGEVVTQGYNCLLATSFLRDTADGVMVLSNDDAVEDLRLRHEGGGKGAMAIGLQGASSFRDINKMMSSQMASLLLPSEFCVPPTSSSSPERRGVHHHQQHRPTAVSRSIRPSTMHDVIESVALDPVRKFFSPFSFPKNPEGLSSVMPITSWSSTTNEMVRITSRLSPFQLLFVLRGSGASTEGFSELEHSMGSTACNYEHGINRHSLSSVFCSDESLNGSVTSSCAFAATPRFSDTIRHVIEKVEGMLDAKAFVHHFDRYGVEEDDLKDACIRCWELAAAYEIR